MQLYGLCEMTPVKELFQFVLEECTKQGVTVKGTNPLCQER